MKAQKVYCAFPGFTQLGAPLGSPGSLAYRRDWSFLVPLHPLVATFLHVGVICLFFNSIIRMECVFVCLFACLWGLGVGEQGQEAGPCP